MNVIKPVITVRNLNVYYGDHCALKDINVDIPEKQITAIVGPSRMRQNNTVEKF